MSVSTNSEISDAAEWLDVEPDEEQIVFASLFDTETFSSIQDLLNHCKTHHAFDLVATVHRLGLEFHDVIKLINFIRDCTKEAKNLPPNISAGDFADDKYLKPVLENDALLFSLDEVLSEVTEGSEHAQSRQKLSCESRKKELEAELAAVKEQFASYRLAVEETLDKRWGDETEAGNRVCEKKKDSSDYYFESYAYNDIHETMLKDEVRTDAYRDFIYENKQLFEGKIVLDIGCGTGILSMFCAKAGATQVIAVDKSDIIDKARENVFNNGLSSTITCLRGAIEDVKLPVDQVDIIVSEWMGYCLLYEAMLPSVLYARDKYLRPEGLLVPSSATIWVAPVQDSEYVTDTVSFWRDVYGFDMKAMQECIYDEAKILTMPPSAVCGEPYPFKVLDLHTVKPEDLFFTASWESQITRDIDSLDGFLVWFDNFFANSRTDKLPAPVTTPENFVKQKSGYVAFTTGPFGKETHWRQGLLLQPPTQLKASKPKLAGQIVFSALEENARALDIQLTWTEEGQQEKARVWKLK
ncbi:arginine methyltransferase [Cordyceps militaris]|uniref:type I protein arginine methyltransferase n=1 Tax=Cordyceps militaris TaxID=73501 RepID=A0A2H4SVE3_CORMI|nr:arginine methyltransferase [Cordyceps militaris]